MRHLLQSAAIALALSAMLNTPTLQAQTTRNAQAPLEASMLVSGTIDISPQGKVEEYSLDHIDKLPAFVTDLIARHVPTWEFEQVIVDGQAVPTRAKMNLRMVAVDNGDGTMQLRIASTDFPIDASTGETVGVERIANTQRLGELAGGTNVSATVHVDLKIGRDGRVMQAHVRQINLQARGSERVMRRVREAYAQEALRIARYSRFTPVTAGPDKDAESWTATLPIAIHVGEGDSPADWQWVAYVPGPISRAPWREDDDDAADSDAMPDNGLRMAGRSLSLRTPLPGS